MSTRSSISLKKNGQFKSIYCHNDGYLEGVGRTLYNNYKTERDVEKLLELGDLSSLGRLPISKPILWDLLPFSPDYAKLIDKYCRAYKDRGDTDVDGTTSKSVKEILDKYDWSEYHYIFDADLGKWFYTTGSTKLKPLFKNENQIREGIDMKKFTITYEVKNDESTGRFRSIIVTAESEERAKEKLLAKRPNIEIIGVHTTEDVDVRKGMPELREAVDNKELLAHQQKIAVAKTTEEEQEPVFADATRNFEKTAKVKAETVKVQEEPKHEEKGKMPKMVPGAKKMHLDESLFEGVAEKRYIAFDHFDPEDLWFVTDDSKFDYSVDVTDMKGQIMVVNNDESIYAYEHPESLKEMDLKIYDDIKNYFEENPDEDYYVEEDYMGGSEIDRDEFNEYTRDEFSWYSDFIEDSYVDNDSNYQYQLINLDNVDFEDPDDEDDEEDLEESLTETKAKPEGNSVAGHNKALELAKKVNKPVIYGYYTKNYGNKYFDTPELIVVENESTIKDFEDRHRGVKVTYVAYPDKSPITEEKEESL